MKKEYYRLAFNVTPSYCKSISYTCVISESFEEFLKRNKGNDKTIQLIMINKSNPEEYKKYKRFNPTNESYVEMKDIDYSIFKTFNPKNHSKAICKIQY